MPPPGTLMTASSAGSLPTFQAISVDPRDPFKINFVLDKAGQDEIKTEELERLVKYFLTFLTIPDEDLWVNLSPYEKDRIVMPDLEVTPVGRDMLIQDYILKQLTASMTYPDQEPGGSFWKEVYSRLKREYGRLDVPVDTFNKVWIVPEKAVVIEQEGAAFIAESRLKVLLEQDYLSIEKNRLKHHVEERENKKINQLSSDVARKVLIPVLDREVNEGEHFAPLRQMYHALILAIWWKQRLKGHLVNQIYVDRKKTAGITIDEERMKEKVYDQYMTSVKKGVYDFIREDYDDTTRELVPRKYFSGGCNLHYSPKWYSRLSLGSVRAFSERFRSYLQSMRRGVSAITISLIPLGGPSREQLLASVMGLGLLGNVAAGTADPGGPHLDAFPEPDEQTVVVENLQRAAFGQIIDLPEGPSKAIHQGDKVGDDLPYFQMLGELMSIEEVRALDGQENPLSQKKYHIDSDNFDSDSMGSNLPKSKNATIDLKVQTVIYAWQRKNKITEDGWLGKEMRASIRAAMEKAGISYRMGDTVIHAKIHVPDTETLIAGSQGMSSETNQIAVEAAADLAEPEEDQDIADLLSWDQLEQVDVSLDTGAASGESVVVPEISATILGQGSTIGEYLPYFEVMRDHLLKSGDVRRLAAETNPKTGRPYQVADSEHWKDHSPDEEADVYGATARDMVRAWQLKEKRAGQNIVVDGLMGKDTRASLREAMQEEGIPFVFEGEKTAQVAASVGPDSSGSQGDDLAGNFEDISPFEEYPGVLLASVDVTPDYPLAASSAQNQPLEGQDLSGTLAAADSPESIAPNAEGVLADTTVPAAAGGPGGDGPPPDQHKKTRFADKYPVLIPPQPVSVLPVEDRMVAQNQGNLKIVAKEGARVKAGQMMFRIEDPETVAKKADLKTQIRIADRRVQMLERKSKAVPGAVPLVNMTEARETLADLLQQYAQVLQDGAGEIVRAPVDLTILKYEVPDGKPVDAETVLVKYHTFARSRFDVTLPLSADYFGNIQGATLNGQPVQGIVRVDWKPEPSEKEARVTFEVIPSQVLSADREVAFEARLGPPQDDSSSALAGISGPSTFAVVDDVEEDKVLAPESGPVHYHVNPGDLVTGGQSVVSMDDRPYRAKLAQLVKARKTLSDYLASPVAKALPGIQQDPIRKNIASLSARITETKTRIAAMNLSPKEGGGLVTWTARMEAPVIEQGAVLARIRTGHVWLGSHDDTSSAILVPKDSVKTGTGVVVETPSGHRLPGRVMVVNRNPFKKRVLVDDLWSVEIRVEEDPSRSPVLWPNMMVKVIVPETEEGQAGVRKMLQEAEARHREGAAAETVRTKGPVPRLSAGRVTYPSVEGDDTGLWTLMRGASEQRGSLNGRLETIERTLIGNINPLQRADALNELLETYDDEVDFLNVVKVVVLLSPHRDVIQQILKYMSERPDPDLRFFVQVIDRAERDQRPQVAEWAYQALRDIFVNRPEVFEHITESNLVENGVVQRSTVRRVFLTMLAREPDSSIALSEFLLKSPFWTLLDLKEIYGEVKAYEKKLQDGDSEYEFQGRIERVLGLIRYAVLRTQLQGNIPDVFVPDFYEDSTFVMEDVYREFLTLELAKINDAVVALSPQWRDSPEGFFSDGLYQRAKRSTDRLLSEQGPGRPARRRSALFYEPLLAPQGGDDLFMDYFSQLGFDERITYLKETRSLTEVGRVLVASQAELREQLLNKQVFDKQILGQQAAQALKRLMKTPQGRLIAMRIALDVLDAGDQDLFDKVAALNWMDVAESTARTIGTPAEMQTFRDFFLAVYRSDPTEEWPLDVRLQTYTWPELSRALQAYQQPGVDSRLLDPRGPEAVQSRIREESLSLAVRFVRFARERRTPFPFWTGYFSPDEERLLRNIADFIADADSPREVDAYVEQLKARLHLPDQRHVARKVADWTVGKFNKLVLRKDDPLAPMDLMKALLSWRDRTVGDMEGNHQDISKLPVSFLRTSVVLGSGLGVLALWVLSGFRRKWIRQNGGAEGAIKRLYSYLAVSGQGNGNGNGASLNGQRDRRLVRPLSGMQEVISRWQSQLHPGEKAHEEAPSERSDADSGSSAVPENTETDQAPGKDTDRAMLATYSPSALFDDLNITLNHMAEITRLTPFSPSLMYDPDATTIDHLRYWKTLQSARDALVEADVSLSELLLEEEIKFNDLQKKRLFLDMDRLKMTVDYFSLYLTVLQARTNIDKVVGEKLPDSHWAERWGLYPKIRKFLGYEYRLNESRSMIEEKLPLLLELGNQIIPGLYPDPEGIEAKSKDLLHSAISQAESLLPVSGERPSRYERMGRFWRRFAFVASPAASVLMVGLGYLLNIPFAKFGFGFSVVTLLTLAANYAFHVAPNHRIIETLKHDPVAFDIDKLDRGVNLKLKRSSEQMEQERRVDPVQRAVDLAKEEGMVRLKEERDLRKEPMVDAVVIISEDRDGTEEVREFVAGEGRSLFRQGIPVEPVHFRGGSDRGVVRRGSLNDYYQAVSYIRRRWEEPDFRESYSDLVDEKSYEEARILFVFAGKQGIVDEDSLERAVINGYRAALSMENAPASQEGDSSPSSEASPSNEHVLVFARDRYDGPIKYQAGADVSLQQSWIAEEDMDRLGMLMTDFPQTGDNTVTRIIEKPSSDQWEELIPGRYRQDEENKAIQEFPGMNGLIMFKRRAVNAVNRVVGVLETADAKDRRLWDALPVLQITSDLLKVWMLSSKKEIKKYFRQRKAWSPLIREDDGGTLKKYYQLLLKVRQEVTGENRFAYKAFVPYPGSESLEQLRGDEEEDPLDPKALLDDDEDEINPFDMRLADSGPRAPDQSMLSSHEDSSYNQPDEAQPKHGGIDISGMQETMDLRPEGQKGPGQDALLPPDVLPLPSLESFQGFEFRILPFQPSAGPIGLILGSGVEHRPGPTAAKAL